MKKRWYVGVKNGKYTAFSSPATPTFQTHGHLYHAVIGPFRTRRGAKFMESNPRSNNVAMAEQLAKLAAVS